SAVGPLTTILDDPDAPGFAVVRALRLLEAIGMLDDASLRRASEHPSAGVRENALQIIGARLRSNPELLDAVVARAEDDDPRVRFQAALALGDARGAPVRRIAAALARIAARDGADRWTRAAVFSSLLDR